MASHTKVVPDMILFFTGNIIEQDNGLGGLHQARSPVHDPRKAGK